jgi:DNA-binding response OmpR family regulator
LFVSGTAPGDWPETDRQSLATFAESSWDFLQKPFNHLTLLSRVRALLNRPPSRLRVRPGCARNGECARLNPAGTGSPVL